MSVFTDYVYQLQFQQEAAALARHLIRTATPLAVQAFAKVALAIACDEEATLQAVLAAGEQKAEWDASPLLVCSKCGFLTNASFAKEGGYCLVYGCFGNLRPTRPTAAQRTAEVGLPTEAQWREESDRTPPDIDTTLRQQAQAFEFVGCTCMSCRAQRAAASNIKSNAAPTFP